MHPGPCTLIRSLKGTTPAQVCACWYARPASESSTVGTYPGTRVPTVPGINTVGPGPVQLLAELPDHATGYPVTEYPGPGQKNGIARSRYPGYHCTRTVTWSESNLN
eukprot:79133-Rhodomonas_salina.2